MLLINCSKCGKSLESKCDCGAPYVYLSPGQLAELAIRKYPEKSTREIAEELGISHMTIERARVTNVTPAPDAKIIGQDGKKYPAKSSKQKQKRKAKHSREVDKLLNKACDFFTGFCHKITDDRWAKALTPDERAEFIKFLHTTANQFTLIAQELSSLNTPPQTEEPSPWQINDTTSVRTGPSFH